MIRIFSLLVGAFFTLALLWSFSNGAYNQITDPAAATAEEEFHQHPRALHLASDGMFGHYDRQQLQRGFAVYQQVCSSCHSIRQVAYRDLEQLGYDEGQVKTLAKDVTINAPDPLTKELKDRPGLASDHFPAVVYAGQGTPPDLSLITKARHGGAAYVYSLLTGYRAQPAELIKHFPDAKTGAGLHYNPWFANLNIAMTPPLTAEGQVTYSDGTKATVDQMAQDVSAFLVWTAEPTQDKRRQTGWAVLGFLIFATVLAYLAKKQIWADLH
jgi:ubiquinol-cytochrome c reductase cytochrome c1 subunit